MYKKIKLLYKEGVVREGEGYSYSTCPHENMMTFRLSCMVRKKVKWYPLKITYRLTKKVTNALLMARCFFGFELE